MMTTNHSNPGANKAVQPTPVAVTSCAAHFVISDLLKKGKWKIHKQATVRLSASFFPCKETRAYGWVGAKMIGSGIIESFLSAFHGLRFWDEMKDPKYYDHLLLPQVNYSDKVKRKTA